MTEAIDRQMIHDVFDDHPSLSASLEDFESPAGPTDPHRPAMMQIPSHHSGFCESDSESDLPESDSGGPWSPPMNARFDIRNGETEWHAQRDEEHISRNSSARSSRESSPNYEDACEGDMTLQAKTFPEMVIKREASPNVELRPDGVDQFADIFRSEVDQAKAEQSSDAPNSLFRFSLRADFQHRADSLVEIGGSLKRTTNGIFKTPRSAMAAIVVTILASLLFRSFSQPPRPGGVPDLISAANLARRFEELVPYSENGFFQNQELQRTSAAVWDLAEKVRSTNMTSGDMIVRQLDSLSQNIEDLGNELTRFFAAVDGDIDGILYAMEFEKRTLAQLSPSHSTYDRMHSMLCRVGMFESKNGEETRPGSVVRTMFGETGPQNMRATLRRAFDHILNAVEQSIENELEYSMTLLGLFEAIDQQFKNLVQTVAAENNEQERGENELLASLWTRLFGANGHLIKKFEKNRLLLQNVREKTVNNRILVVDHKKRLGRLKASLEYARRQVTGPFIRNNQSTIISIEAQVAGLNAAYEPLRSAREQQKTVIRRLHALAGNRWAAQSLGAEPNPAIEGSKS